MKNLFKFCLVTAMIFLPFSCNQDSMDADTGVESFNKSGNSKKSAIVLDHTFAPIQGTSSILHRNKNGITVNFKTKGLIPGNAYTLWWVIWNNPEECLTPNACGDDADFGNALLVKPEVLYAAGHVVGGSGIGNFSAHLNLNDDSGSVNDLFGLPPAGGLLETQEAEVHLVLRSHGVAQPGMIPDQIHSYLGGCTDSGGFGPDSSVEGYCRDIQAAIHAPIILK